MLTALKICMYSTLLSPGALWDGPVQGQCGRVRCLQRVLKELLKLALVEAPDVKDPFTTRCVVRCKPVQAKIRERLTCAACRVNAE